MASPAATPPQPHSEPLVVELRGHLTRASLEESLTGLGEALEQASERVPVIIDCLVMHGYDLDARHAFVEWNSRWRHKVSRVAIITTNRVYHVVIAGMALAARQAMRGFMTLEEAREWALS